MADGALFGWRNGATAPDLRPASTRRRNENDRNIEYE
jgi:hypothetical protein